MTKKELTKRTNVSAMAITNYENGTKKPSMETLQSLGDALGVSISDFLAVRDENILFAHGEYCKSSSLSTAQQEYICECIEESMALR